jgi:putative membrane protein
MTMERRKEPRMADVMKRESQAGEVRADYAEDRTLLANERTYAAWIRTGLAALVAGIAFERFIPGTIPAWSVRLIAVILILYSVACFYLAFWRYRHLGLKFPHLKLLVISTRFIAAITMLLVVASLLALIGLWLV